MGTVLNSNDFYDLVANEYNSHMTEADIAIRKIVCSAFIQKVSKGNVLDFGGGTGLDISWLSKEGYQVFFLEPSDNMRVQAKHLNKSLVNAVIFLENVIDFHTWSPEQLPTTKKMDGLLANFAVLNCIMDIDMLFEKLPMICNKGCYLFATVIDSRLPSLIKNYKLPVVVKRLLNIKPVIYSNYKNSGHPTYLHSVNDYRRASGANFDFISFSPLGYSNMALLILKRK